MVNSHGGGSFSKSPRVVDGYTKVFHDVFGGPLSESAEDGMDTSLSGWHTRSAVREKCTSPLWVENHVKP
ncbi:TPA: hypothetical protein EYO77_09220 [Candidatus Poribacteria bacterium]|nr:hypothetical protein [Candidatus Poribacteria bacterium]